MYMYVCVCPSAVSPDGRLHGVHRYSGFVLNDVTPEGHRLMDILCGAGTATGTYDSSVAG